MVGKEKKEEELVVGGDVGVGEGLVEEEGKGEDMEEIVDQFKSLLKYYIDNNKVTELEKDFQYLSPYINIVLITQVCNLCTIFSHTY